MLESSRRGESRHGFVAPTPDQAKCGAAGFGDGQATAGSRATVRHAEPRAPRSLARHKDAHRRRPESGGRRGCRAGGPAGLARAGIPSPPKRISELASAPFWPRLARSGAGKASCLTVRRLQRCRPSCRISDPVPGPSSATCPGACAPGVNCGSYRWAASTWEDWPWLPLWVLVLLESPA